MKKILSIGLLLLSVSGMAQTFPKAYIDSLTSVALARKNNDPITLNRDSVLQLLFKATLPADRIRMFYDIVGNYDELTPEQALYYHQLILDSTRKNKDKVLEAAVLAELGFITSRNGKTAEGLKMIYQSLEKAEETGNAQAIGIAYNNLGNCYPNNIQLSKEYYNKALTFSRKGKDYDFVVYNLGNIGNIFMKENKRDSALAYFLESYRLAVEKNVAQGIVYELFSLSELDDGANAFHYFQQISRFPFAVRNLDVQRSLDGKYAVYYMRSKKMDSAFYFASRVFNAVKNADLSKQLDALNLMAMYYEALPNADSALLYFKSYYQLKDSLFGNKVIEQTQEMAYNDMQRSKELAKQKTAYQNRLRLYGVSAIAAFLLLVAFLFWRSKKKEENARILVQQQKEQLQETLIQLKQTQTQLIQSEKMASLGELTAGIAHEIQNPLNFVNNFSEVSNELIDEMNIELGKGDIEEAKIIAFDVKSNLEKINHHGKRAADIVKGMLQHSRSSSGVKEPTDINALCDEYLRLSYHGLRAKDKSFNATMKTDFDTSLEKVNIIPQDIGRVILNLLTNAFYVVEEKKKSGIENYEPTVSITTKKVGDEVLIKVTDNGNGIPQKVLDKIFQPFFTTKPTGQGTGLGLSLSYDIIKAHGGELKVETKEGAGTTFIIQLPI